MRLRLLPVIIMMVMNPKGTSSRMIGIENAPDAEEFFMESRDVTTIGKIIPTNSTIRTTPMMSDPIIPNDGPDDT